jgi:hypothetical protein
MGAIRKRGKNYIITYYERSGSRRWETVGPNLHEARQVLADRMSERRNGKSRVPRDQITVGELVQKWKENYLTVQQQLGRLKPSTLRSYQSNLDGHIGPFFGAVALSEVRLASVQDFIKTLLGKGLSPKTIGNVIVILKEMFKHAVHWGIWTPTRCNTLSGREVRTRRWTSSPRTRFVGCSTPRRSRCGRCC